MAKMNWLLIMSLLLLLASNPAYSRLISEGNVERESSDWDDPKIKPFNFIQSELSSAAETCEPLYGILPCSSNRWGLFFLIVVYEILLSFGGRYVGIGSELFFQAIGPDHAFGASVFQFLGTIPQIILVLGSSLGGSVEAAQQQATMGMGLVAGTTVLLLTLLWGTSVVLGSYNISEAHDPTESPGRWGVTPTFRGSGVVTDAETSYTARLISATLVPFLIILLAKINSTSGRSWIILTALLVTVVLLIGYAFYQSFQPWIRHRRFEHLMDTYAQDKLVKLCSKDGKADQEKIKALFTTIDVDNDHHISPFELQVWLFGANAHKLSTERDVENIVESFDTSGNQLIEPDEFLVRMTELVSERCKQIPDHLKKTKGTNSPGLLFPESNNMGTGTRPKATNSWLDYLKAIAYLIFGIAIMCALAEPLTRSVVDFSRAANLSSFWVSYLVIPLATHYRVVIDTIDSARHKTHMAISLTLSTLYGGAYMNNIVGLIAFLAPVYARNLSVNVFRDVLVVLIICIIMTLLTSFRTTFPRWVGYAVVLLYPISLALLYPFNSAALGL